MATPVWKLSDYLLQLDQPKFKLATQHPFITKAGDGTLDELTLSAWLSQDHLYLISYIRFATLLMSSCAPLIPLSHRPLNKDKIRQAGLDERVMDMLADSMNNVRREIQFFGETSSMYGLNLDYKVAPGEGVRKYRDLFESQGQPGKSLSWDEPGKISDLLGGLVVLWGTEIVRSEVLL